MADERPRDTTDQTPEQQPGSPSEPPHEAPATATAPTPVPPLTGEPRPAFPRLVGNIAGKAFPLYLSMAASVFGTMVTAGVLGHTGTAVLAAYAMTVALYNPASMVVQGALRGSMPFVAGNSEDPAALVPTVRNALWLALCIGLLGSAVVASVPLVARLIGVPDQTVAAFGLLPYLMALALLANAFQACATTLLIGLGRSGQAMTVGLVGTALSVVLVPALVLVLGLGATGAGLAVLLTALAVTAVAHTLLRRGTVLAGQNLGPGSPDWAGIWHIARVGLPMGSTMLIKFGVLGLLAMAVARIGSTEAAAHQVMVTLVTFVFLPATATGQAAVPFMARAARAAPRNTPPAPGRPSPAGDETRSDKGFAEVRRTLLAGLALALPVIALSMLLVRAAVVPVVGVLTPDPEVVALVTALVPALFVVVLADGVQAMPGMGLLALKRTTPPLYAFAVCFGLLALAAFPVAAAGGLAWLWWAYALANLGLVLGQGGSFLLLTRTPPGPSPA
ncbi:putative multidrug resistance protein NorM [Nocardiopsis terrae]|uniref:MATE family multidrug resistance protein n=1 Tax=Nocardiopsis terrae TaxID=372655 RepID=A0ABR9HKN6_9ACTN|nr:MATE family efflux transporter [Nocardiopsis terrae]MBE1459538.1 MATE family multidrug resistance protein [Nocardiopsis terrae]GHC95152.1 putative multidrug resistance protein NorM [Nocardiopsis terrae]